MRKCEFSLELEHYFRLESIGNRATTAADGVIDLSNVRLVSLFVSGNQGGTVVFGNIQVSAEMPAGYPFNALDCGHASSHGNWPMRV